MLHVDDDGFVRAPVGLVYRRLTDVSSYGSWWPGVRARPIGAGGAELHELVARHPLPRRSLRVVIHPHAWRHDAGFHLTLEGDVEGRAEWWLEEGWGGTVVHHLAAFEPVRLPPRAALTVYRRTLRRGLWAFKDLVQSEIRQVAGAHP